jgi:hypothetical protein
MQGNSRLPLVQLILVGLLLAVLIMQGFLLYDLRMNQGLANVHTVVLNWTPRTIIPRDVTSGYVANWTWPMDVRIVAVNVWMGNPSGILWEGDVYVSLNKRGIFNNSTDQVVVHYQFDKHAEGSTPHQLMFQIGSGGFLVRAGQTVWVWRAFENISNESAFSGDGQVIICYVAG